MLLATTGNGWVIPLQIKDDGISEGGIAAGPLPLTATPEVPINFACWYSGGTTTPPPAITNTGGTGQQQQQHGSAGQATYSLPLQVPLEMACMCQQPQQAICSGFHVYAAQDHVHVYGMLTTKLFMCYCCADITPGPDGQYYRWCAKVRLLCTH